MTQVDEKRIALRLPVELYEQLRELSEIERRSLNSQIIYLLEISLTEINRLPGWMKLIKSIQTNGKEAEDE